MSSSLSNASPPSLTALSPTQIEGVGQHLRALADRFDRLHEEILESWRKLVESDSQLEHSPQWSRAKLQDHIPQGLELFSRKLRAWPADTTSEEVQEEHRIANLHSIHRWQQGFELPAIMREWGHLNLCVVMTLDELQHATATAITTAQKEAEVITDATATDTKKVESPSTLVESRRAAWRIARALWANLINESISQSALEYNQLLQAEASARSHKLEVTFAELREVERARGELLRSVAHDLRGGLSVVGGTAEMIDNEKLPPGDRAHVHEMMRRSVKSLHDMISNLMDMSRLEAGQEIPRIAEFDAAQLLRELCDTLHPMANQRNLQLTCEGPDSLPVQGDGLKVQRIAQNLLLNALKYTQQGSVAVSWQTVENQWYLQIRDTGPGLQTTASSPITSKLAEATEVAHEVDGDTLPAAGADESATITQNATPSGGEGIGLSIVKRLCELLNATLELETQPGKGTTFRVTFPTQYDS